MEVILEQEAQANSGLRERGPGRKPSGRHSCPLSSDRLGRKAREDASLFHTYQCSARQLLRPASS